jgi:two-component system LytT family response regulator
MQEEVIKCIIIDDEEPARRALRSMLELYCPEVKVVDEAGNVPDGVLAINRNIPQLVFLDIEMPGYTGFDLFEFIKEVNFEIIFVTAYSEYAIRAFEVSAVDYLLKPVVIDHLIAAVDKARKKVHAANMQQRVELLKESRLQHEFSRLALPVTDGLLFVEVADIMMLEAEGAYTHVWLRNGTKVLVSKKLRFFEDVLSARSNFFRPHRSYIVNFNFVSRYSRGESSLVMDNKVVIPVSKERKSDLEAVIRTIRVGL